MWEYLILTAETGACFIIGLNGGRILAQQSVSLLLTCSVSLSHVMLMARYYLGCLVISL